MASTNSRNSIATPGLTKKTIALLEEKGYIDECRLVRLLQSCKEYKKPSVTSSSRAMNASGAKIISMFIAPGSMHDVSSLLPKMLVTTLTKTKKFKATTFDETLSSVQSLLDRSEQMIEVSEMILSPPT